MEIGTREIQNSTQDKLCLRGSWLFFIAYYFDLDMAGLAK